MSVVERAIEWIRSHRLETALFGGIAVLGIILFANLLLSDSGATTTTTLFIAAPNGSRTSTTQASKDYDPSEHPDVAQLDCDGLLTLEDDDYALGVEGQLAGMFQYEFGETCTDVLGDDESFWVDIEPGHPDDFILGRLEGMSGSPVGGIGDDAIWFGGDAVSVITVFKTVELGGLYYRIRLSRPDLTPAEELPILTELATRALPRFPGVVLDQPEPQTVTVDIQGDDPAKLGYTENLLAKEADGEWTLGEGLLATLQLLAGEVDGSGVLRYPDMVSFDHSSIVTMAMDYLTEAGPDDPGAQQIAGLLPLLAPTAAPEPTTGVRVILAAYVFQEEEEQDPVVKTFCLAYGNPDCVDEWVVTTEEAEYTLYTLKPEYDSTWSAEDIEVAINALGDTALKMVTSDTAPPTAIILNPHPVGIDVYPVGDRYIAQIGTDMIGAEPGVLQQAIAYAAAKAIVEAKYGKDFWLNEGMALYLSEVVFPEAYYQEALLGRLAGFELTRPLTDWGPMSWLFFRYLDGPLDGPQNVFNFAQLPEAQIATLFHQFAEDLTDGKILTLGENPAYIGYTGQTWDLPINFLMNADLVPPPFVIRRINLVVEPGQTACMDILESGAVQVSWRQESGDGGYQAPWESDLPLSIQGTSTLIITSTGPGFVDFNITRFVDNPDDCTEPPPDPNENLPGPVDPLCNCDPTEFMWNPNVIHIHVDIGPP